LGDPKKRRKQFEGPRKPWDKARIEEESKLEEAYGLKNRKEIWRAKTAFRKKRHNARQLLGKKPEERERDEKDLVNSLVSLGVLNSGAVLDDILGLESKDLFERRLQTIVFRKNLANTIKQSRQFITHGHVAVNGKKVSIPGYLVKKAEEASINYYGKPMIIEAKKATLKSEEKDEGKKDLKKEFEEVKEAAETKEAEETEKETRKKVKVNE